MGLLVGALKPKYLFNSSNKYYFMYRVMMGMVVTTGHGVSCHNQLSAGCLLMKK